MFAQDIYRDKVRVRILSVLDLRHDLVSQCVRDKRFV